jgi:hypothetical protein
VDNISKQQLTLGDLISYLNDRKGRAFMASKVETS